MEQILLTIEPNGPGFHLITAQVIQALPSLPQVGLAHLFLKHTSAALTLNENTDPDVRLDLHDYFDQMVSRDVRKYRHILEGSDDMPAHIKASLLGFSLSIPIQDGKLALGRWQGIYLAEFRDHPPARHILISITSVVVAQRKNND